MQVMAHRHRSRTTASGTFGTAWPVYGGSYGSMTGYYGGGWAGNGGLVNGVVDQVGDSALSAAQFGGSDGAGSGDGAGSAGGAGGT